MPYLTAQLVQLSFAGIAFPYKEITMDGEMRHHVHEYPHSPGGLPEKLGRKLYAFDITVPFHGNLIPPQYKGLWPENLAMLVSKFELGMTEDLVIPQIGAPIRAFCTNWKRVLKSTNTVGETVTLKFLEDDEDRRLPNNITKVKLDKLTPLKSELEVDAGNSLLGSLSRSIDSILRLVDGVLAYRDLFDAYSTLMLDKLESVISMIHSVIETSQYIANPENWAVTDRLHELWRACLDLRDDLAAKNIVIKTYVVPAAMTLAQVAWAIYKQTGRSSDLMQLNVIDDPLEIRRGAVIRFYPD